MSGIRYADDVITHIASNDGGAYSIRQTSSAPKEMEKDVEDEGDERDIKKKQTFKGKYLFW